MEMYPFTILCHFEAAWNTLRAKLDLLLEMWCLFLSCLSLCVFTSIVFYRHFSYKYIFIHHCNIILVEAVSERFVF